jgi:hypothetical protein
MKTHFALGLTAIVCLGLAPHAQAADSSPAKQSLAIPVNLPGRPAGSVECTVTLGPVVPVTALAFSPDGKTLAAGDYLLRLADVQGRGGDEYAYRLSIAPPGPDFVLRTRPDRIPREWQIEIPPMRV